MSMNKIIITLIIILSSSLIWCTHKINTVVSSLSWENQILPSWNNQIPLNTGEKQAISIHTSPDLWWPLYRFENTLFATMKIQCPHCMSTCKEDACTIPIENKNSFQRLPLFPRNIWTNISLQIFWQDTDFYDINKTTLSSFSPDIFFIKEKALSKKQWESYVSNFSFSILDCLTKKEECIFRQIKDPSKIAYEKHPEFGLCKKWSVIVWNIDESEPKVLGDKLSSILQQPTISTGDMMFLQHIAYGWYTVYSMGCWGGQDWEWFTSPSFQYIQTYSWWIITRVVDEFSWLYITYTGQEKQNDEYYNMPTRINPWVLIYSFLTESNVFYSFAMKEPYSVIEKNKNQNEMIEFSNTHEARSFIDSYKQESINMLIKNIDIILTKKQ